MSPVPGPLRFARYAYPPNVLGYCGPGDHRSLLEYAATNTEDKGLRELAKGFAGAWPYLQLIGGASHLDPLADEVVAAYWVGSDLLNAVRPAWLAASLDDRFASRLGAKRSLLGDVVAAGAVPHHSFHVLAVSPWIGLLRAGYVDQPLETLDRCRIRVGTVVALQDGAATVRTDTLHWDGERLVPGIEVADSFTTSGAGYSLPGDIRLGDHVSLHWGWVCERLTTRQAGQIEHFTAISLDAVNRAPTPDLERALA